MVTPKTSTLTAVRRLMGGLKDAVSDLNSISSASPITQTDALPLPSPPSCSNFKSTTNIHFNNLLLSIYSGPGVAGAWGTPCRAKPDTVPVCLEQRQLKDPQANDN